MRDLVERAVSGQVLHIEGLCNRDVRGVIIDPVLKLLQGGLAKMTSGRQGTTSSTAATSPTSR